MNPRDIISVLNKLYKSSPYHSTKDLIFITIQTFKRSIPLLNRDKFNEIYTLLEPVIINPQSSDKDIRIIMTKIIMVCKSEHKKFLTVNDPGQSRVMKIRNIMYNMQKAGDEIDNPLLKQKCHQAATLIHKHLHKFSNKQIDLLFKITQKQNHMDVHDIMEIMTIINLTKMNPEYGNTSFMDRLSRGANNLIRNIFPPTTDPNPMNY